MVWFARLVVCLILGSQVCRPSQAQTTELAPKVKESLQRYANLETATWSWEGSVSFAFQGKKSTYSVMGSYVRLGQKFAWSRHTSEGKKATSDHRIRFDGSTIAASNDNKQMTWYAIEKISKTQPTNFKFSVPYFDAIGLHYPKENKFLVEGTLESKILYLLKKGAELVRVGAETLGEKQVTVIELEAAHEVLWNEMTNTPEKDRLLYYLSTAEDYGVIKHERRTLQGRKWFESSVTTLSTGSDDLPMLGKDVTIKVYLNMESTEFQVVNEAKEVTTLKVKSPLLLPSSNDDFVLKKESAKAGTQLIDGVTPELQHPDGSISVFNMPASPDDLDKAIAAASVKRSYGSAIVWIIGLAVIIGGGLAAYFQYRKSRQGKQR